MRPAIRSFVFLLFVLTFAKSFPVVAQVDPDSKQKRIKSSPYKKFTPVPDQDSRVEETFLNLGFAVGKLLTVQSGGRMNVSFPYALVNSAATVDSSFTGSGVNPLHKPSPSFGVSMQFGTRKIFVDLAGGAGAANNSFWSVGVGRTLLFRDPVMRTFYLKAILALTHYKLTSSLGTFDAPGVKVWALGESFDPTFTYPDGYGNNNDRSTADMEFIRVGYAEITWAVHPTLSAEWHPFNSGFFVEFSVGYLLPFSEHGKLEVRPASEDHNGDERKVSIAYPGTTASFGGHTFTSSPFNLNSVQVGIRVGSAVRSFWTRKKK